MAKPKRTMTVEVPDGEGWTRTVEVPVDEALTRPYKEWLKKAAKISGHRARDCVEARQAFIRKTPPANWATHLTLEARGHTREAHMPKLPDAMVTVKLSTAEVLVRIREWETACLTGYYHGATLMDVGELVNTIHGESEEWGSIIKPR